MKLGMEIPRSWLETLSPLTDIDFALAQLVLEDKYYAAFYANQAKAGRFVILDNGMHELGHPLSVPELVRAIDVIHPSVVVAPDRLKDQRYGLEQFFETVKVVPQGVGVAIVIQGVSAAERAEMFMKTAKYAKMVCFPFREPRFEWFCDLLEKIPKHVAWPARIHLMGVNELWELKAFRDKFEDMNIPSRRVSVDTSKPIKFGILRKRLTADIETLRGTGGLDELAKTAKAECMTDIMYNVAFLRRYL